MRDVMFRGLHKGAFIFGCYVHNNESGGDYHAIISQDPTDEDSMLNQTIDPKTAGQLTGIQIDGVDAYDGDIIEKLHFTDSEGDHFLRHIIKWSDKFCGWFAMNEESKNDDDGSVQLWVYMKANKCNAKIVGNIHQG